MTEDQINNTNKKGRLSPAVLLSLFLAGMVVFVAPLVVFFTTLRRGSQQQKIIHFLIDDYSESAQLGEINLAQEHCKASSQLYLKGDTLLQIAFANRPEIIVNKVLDSMAPGIPLVNCKKQNTPSDKVGDNEGTSLTYVMDYVQTLVRNTRAKGFQQPIIVTITIQHAEQDLEGSYTEIERENRYKNLRNIVLQITRNNNIVIRIIGPIGDLQTGLNEHLGDLSNVEICPRNEIIQCLEKSFELGRSN